MDPNAALENLRSAIADYLNGDEQTAQSAIPGLVEAADALDEWLSRGGFLPTEWDKGVMSRQQ